MANNLSNTYEARILDWVNNVGTPTRPSGTFVALYTSAPNTETGGGTEVANAGAYARTAVTFGAASGGSASNSAEVTFPTATANWGTVSHLAITDSGTYGGGNIIWSGPLTASKTVETGDTFKITVGSLTLALD